MRKQLIEMWNEFYGGFGWILWLVGMVAGFKLLNWISNL